MDLSTISLNIGGIKKYSSSNNSRLNFEHSFSNNINSIGNSTSNQESIDTYDNNNSLSEDQSPNQTIESNSYDALVRNYFGDFTVDWILNIIEGGAKTPVGTAFVLVSGLIAENQSESGNVMTPVSEALSFFINYTLKDKKEEIVEKIVNEKLGFSLNEFVSKTLVEIPKNASSSAVGSIISAESFSLFSESFMSSFASIGLNAVGSIGISAIFDYLDDGEISWGTQIYKGSIISVFAFAGTLLNGIPGIGTFLGKFVKGIGFAVADATVGLYKTETGRAVGGAAAITGAAVGTAVGITLAAVCLTNPVGWAVLAIGAVGCLVGAAVGVAATCIADNNDAFE